MANKFLDDQGLLYFWQKIINKFVQKETGKGLSTNDYTTDEKAKLGGIAEGANKTIITDNLTSTSTTDALSAAQGKVLDEKISAINTSIQGAGKGDMQSVIWDTNNNGKVDNADNADNADKLGGELPSAYVKQNEITNVAKTGSYNDLKDKPTNFAPGVHTHEISDVNDLEDTIGIVTAIANGKCHAEVFNTEEEMNAWIANTENTKNLRTGDVFLIRAVNVPDYWWDGSSAQILETTKVELNVISNADIDAIVATS